MKDFIGTVMFTVLNKVIETWDYKEWLEKYGKRLVGKLVDQVEIDKLDDKLQDELLDPIKKKLEKWTGLNL